MTGPNIYDAVVWQLHGKVRELIDALNTAGQIDHDDNKSPHVVAVDKVADSVYRCSFLRNGKQECFTVHTRKKAEPIKTWNEGDGWARPAPREPEPASDGPRKERERRTFESICDDLMEQILPRR
jgi:hypothetical protein